MGTKWNQPTFADVARDAGVPVHTVIAVILGRRRAEDVVRALVLESAAGLGFVRGAKRPLGNYVCAAPGCQSRLISAKVCGMHRERMRLHGAYELPQQPSGNERFWSNVKKGDGCWMWTGSVSDQGYGILSIDKVSWYAHRYAYVQLVGPIAKGMHLDHVCHNRDPGCGEGLNCLHRRCVNPGHLEPVTGRVNVGRAAERRQACRRGHPRTPGNVYIRSEGYQVCRACVRLRREAKVAGFELEPTRRTVRTS